MRDESGSLATDRVHCCVDSAFNASHIKRRTGDELRALAAAAVIIAVLFIFFPLLFSRSWNLCERSDPKVLQRRGAVRCLGEAEVQRSGAAKV